MKQPPSPVRTKRALWAEGIAVVVLLAVYWCMAASGLRQTTITADEGFHLVSGYAYWTEGDFRYQSENGNLPQRLGAVPLLFFKERPLLPDTYARANGNHFDLAAQFLWQSGNDPEAMILDGRLMMLSTMGLGLCLLTWWLARRQWGATGGLIALTLAVFSTDLLAHGGLITSDATFAFLMLASVACVWGMLHRMTAWTVIGTGLMLGLTAVGKFSAPLVGVMALIMWGACLVKNAPVTAGLRHAKVLTGRLGKFGCQCAAFAVAAVVAWVVLWGFYDFRFSGAPEGAKNIAYSNSDTDLIVRCIVMKDPKAQENFRTPADVEEAVKNVKGMPALIQKVAQWRLLPEAYVHGFLHTYAYSLQRSAFLLGERSSVGWRSYFLVTFGIKSPLALFGLIGVGVVAWGVWLGRAPKGKRGKLLGEGLYHLTPYLAGILVYGGMAVMTNLNIGHRHILPLDPLLFIVLGGMLRPWMRWKALWGAVIGALLVWYVAVALWICPHFLAYFNPILGGPSQGYKALIDSSLDWGQDVPSVVKAVEKLRAEGDREPMYYALFGSGWPEHYGLKTRYLPAYRVTGAVAQISVPPLEGGLYLIHATQLQNVYVDAPIEWSPQADDVLRQLTLLVQSWQLRARSAQDFAQLLANENPANIQIPAQATAEQRANALLNTNLGLLARYGNLRFAKLCQWLRLRKPDFQIGYTVNAYRLTQTDLEEVGLVTGVGIPEPMTDALAQMLGMPRAQTRYDK